MSICVPLSLESKRVRADLSCPVQDRALVVDLVAQALYHFTRRPPYSVVAGSLLLLDHIVQDRYDPVFEFAIIVVRHEQVADPVETSAAQICAVQVELSSRRNISRSQAFDQIFFDPTSGRDQAIDVFVLDQEANDLSKAGGNQIRRVAEENVTSRLLSDCRVEFLNLRRFIDRLV